MEKEQKVDWYDAPEEKARQDLNRIYRRHRINDYYRYYYMQRRITLMDKKEKKYVSMRSKAAIRMIDSYVKIGGFLSLLFAIATFVRAEINPYYSSISLVEKSKTLVILVLLYVVYCIIALVVKMRHEYIVNILEQEL